MAYNRSCKNSSKSRGSDGSYERSKPTSIRTIPSTFVLIPLEDVVGVPSCCAIEEGGRGTDRGKAAGLVEERSEENSSNRSRILCTCDIAN